MDEMAGRRIAFDKLGVVEKSCDALPFVWLLGYHREPKEFEEVDPADVRLVLDVDLEMGTVVDEAEGEGAALLLSDERLLLLSTVAVSGSLEGILTKDLISALEKVTK